MTTAMPSPTLDDARHVLRERFGYAAFRGGQEHAITSVFGGRDTLVVMPTGGGKSLCYQVPALLLPGLTVVVSPLISLMKDQVDALNARGLPAAFINSTLSSAQSAERFQRAARGDIKLLYVAPERFDFGNTAERLREVGVSLLAVDEAHCISEWGHDFRPSYLRMRSVRERLGSPVTVALTATATPEVRTDIAAQLGLEDPVKIVTGFDRKNLRWHVVPVKNDAAKDAALVDVLARHDGLAVVYASTRKSVERVTAVLQQARIGCVAYHAGLDDAHRHEVQDAFMSGKVRAIVATNAFGMGIDKPDVRLVVHHAMPGSLEAYYQEAGRAGRDGLSSDVFLLHSFPDRFTHEFFIKGAYPERPLVEQVYERLRRDADASGLVSGSPADIAVALPGKVSPREVESVLRVLAQGEAIRAESESYSRVVVRLLATPARIKRELIGPREGERELLRALWRVAGPQLDHGAIVDLDRLPSGMSTPAAMAMLEDLQGRQFVSVSRAGGGIRLLDARRPLARFAIDWPQIDRRRRAETSKLDAMQKYAYHRACRRQFVLRYFGDAAADASARCDGCDNCLGIVHEAPASIGVPKPAARRDRLRERARAPEAADVALGTEDGPLFEVLRALRSEIARAEHVPAYVVFADRTLAELALRRPRTLAAMSDVRGVGPAKLEKYGERFLEAIRRGDSTEAA